MSQKKLKAPKPLSIIEEEIFRRNDEMRKDLRQLNNSDIFRMAVNIVLRKRREVERITESLALGADPVVSVRMNSQRIGIEAFLDALDELTQPWPEAARGDEPAVFGADAAAQELAKRGISL